MPRKLSYYIFVILAMGTSLLISSYLLETLFVEKSPTPMWDRFQTNMAELKQKTLLAQSSVLTYVEQMTGAITAVKPTPLPAPTEAPLAAQPSNDFTFDTMPAPTSPQPPTPIPTLYRAPTTAPTNRPVPTTSRAIPSPVRRSTATPAPKPTAKPEPTKPPKPPVDVDFPKVVGDPLKQKWYANGSLACYTTERFIEVYAEGMTPNACYKNVQAHMDANKVSMTLLGRSIQVHKKALPAFEAVAKTLDQYKVDSSTYKFPSKTYKIKNVGAYIFRCNVNASTSGKADTCSEGCKLSPHAFGIGVDINYDENCNGCKNYDMPKEISDTFEMYGFRWGGHYPLIGSYIDPMHFEYMRDLCEGV